MHEQSQSEREGYVTRNVSFSLPSNKTDSSGGRVKEKIKLVPFSEQ